MKGEPRPRLRRQIVHNQPPDPQMHVFLSGGGQMGELMRQHDWSASSLGPPETWPRSLGSIAGLMLSSKFPMFLAWGPDLGFLYNDAYAPILGEKHPQALGQPFEKVWSEIWADIAPLIEKALAGEATWAEDLPLLMQRHGYAEETFFTFSYSPAFDDHGQVVGVFCTCTETTDRVLADRRLEAERQRQRRMLQQMPGFVGMLSGPDLVYEYVNDAYVQISERTDFVGRRFRDVFADIDGQGYFEAFESVFATGRGIVMRGMELRLHGRDDTQFIDFVLEPIRDEEGEVLGVFVGGYETTEVYRRGVALQESAEHLRLLVNELNHRVKNSLATVQAIAGQTFKSAETFEQSKMDFSSRLVSLAQAHDVLTETNWSGAAMREIVDRTVGPHGGSSGPRFYLEGPDVVLAPNPRSLRPWPYMSCAPTP